MTVLLTGASGFVGRAILQAAENRGTQVRSIFRCEIKAKAESNYDAVVVPTLDGTSDWSDALRGIDVVVHAAALVPHKKVHLSSLSAAYRRVNCEGSENLAQQAAAAGVRRFVYISSIKVNGELTELGRRFTAEDIPAPVGAYAISKAESEVALKRIAEQTGMELCIIRPPLVYGPQVKGNFATLARWIRKGFPLPFGNLNTNRRSLVALDNLVDLIFVCIQHPLAANQTFLISDGEDLSTADLLTRIARAMQRRPRLLCVPSEILSFVAFISGMNAVAQRMFGSLEVDITKTCDRLGWRPPVSVDEALRRAVE